MYSEGIGVAGATAAATRMAEAHGKWGEKHYGDVRGTRRHRRRRPRSWSTGSRGPPSPSSSAGATPPAPNHPAGRAAQLMQILREWRGGTPPWSPPPPSGSRPLEAILTNEGPGQAKFFGWPEPFPDFSAIKAQARRGGGDHRPALRLGTGRCPRRREVLRASRPGVDGPASRHPVGSAALLPGRDRIRDRLE